MWSCAHCMENSDETKIMKREETETESEEPYAGQKYHDRWRKQGGSYHNLDHKFCLMCKEPRYEVEGPEPGRRRTRRTKDQLQHCPSCHCPPETIKYPIGRANYPKNVDAALNECQDLSTDPANQTFKKFQNNSMSPRMCRVLPCSHSSGYPHHHSKKRTTSTHRRQCRNDQDQSLQIVRNMFHCDINDNEYPPHTKNSYKKENCWRNDQMMTSTPGTVGMDRDIDEKYTLHETERLLKSEIRNLKYMEHMNKIELGDYEDDDSLHTTGKLKFSFRKTYKENDEVERKKQAKKKSDTLPTKLSILKACSSKNKNVEDLSKHKVSMIDKGDYSKDEDLSKEAENRSFYKPCQRSAIRQDSSYGFDKELTSNREENKEATYCELAVKDEEQESSNRKSIYASGDHDLDLRATKSYILGLIDRVLSKKFTTPSGQQKNSDSSRESTEQGICVEINRALQSDCYKPLIEDMLRHCEPTTDRINQLRTLRWHYMKHIQNELQKLCNLQMYLDDYSPRQLLPSFQSHSGAVEQRDEERQQQQQQHEEQQNLGTIS